MFVLDSIYRSGNPFWTPIFDPQACNYEIYLNRIRIQRMACPQTVCYLGSMSLVGADIVPLFMTHTDFGSNSTSNNNSRNLGQHSGSCRLWHAGMPRSRPAAFLFPPDESFGWYLEPQILEGLIQAGGVQVRKTVKGKSGNQPWSPKIENTHPLGGFRRKGQARPRELMELLVV